MLDYYLISKEVEKLIKKDCVSPACRVELTHNILSIHTSDDCQLDVEVETTEDVVETLKAAKRAISGIKNTPHTEALKQFLKVLNDYSTKIN